ncbi:MAG TPA: thioredoxin family protein [Kiritimatiellia bacterium]|nr:thioredoxin family protein [Kiritimatiellia bacterium]HRZ11249.1 thioredoxin family protein [Kiritimatiellia bacterium]HSA19100.1 thioredoxin family protein [Kiritimatiellia bacterium]
MKGCARTAVILMVVGLALIVWAEISPDGAAPDFTLPGIDGVPHSLSSARGKYVVLEWFNYDCPFVRKHYGGGNMQALQKKYTEAGAVWFSICSSAPGKQGHYPAEKMAELAKQRNVASTAVLLDPDGRVGRLYGAKTTPHIFIIDPEGKLIYQGAVDSVPSADPADITSAVNYVRAALDAALAGQPVEKKVTAPYGCSVKY